jgi:hypothetical protein
MPSHKTINSIVNSLTESFTSLMNYSGNDYILGHIVSNAWKTKDNLIEIDFIKKEYTNNKLVNKFVEKSIKGYINGFEDLVERSNSSMAFIINAKMTIEVDGSIKYPIKNGRYFESPYKCSTEIIDEKGKRYYFEKKGTWYPEN